MSKIVVIYKSNYGSTQRYAAWIAEELNAELLEVDKTRPPALQGYDVIIYGGGLYAGSVNGISLLTKNFDTIKDKSLYLFTVGAADVTDPRNTDHIRAGLSRVLTPEMQKRIGLFHLRGGMDCPNMNPLHRMMMGMMIHMLRKKPESELENSDRELLQNAKKRIDFTNRATIAPLVEAVKTANRA